MAVKIVSIFGSLESFAFIILRHLLNKNSSNTPHGLLPPFSLSEAKEMIKKDLGNETYNSIFNLSEPIAAASIAQVHKAQINDNGTVKVPMPQYNSNKSFGFSIKSITLSIIPSTKYLFDCVKVLSV